MMYLLLSSELRIQFSAGQFWQRNRGNIGISRQPLVGSPRRGCRTKGLDPARREMPYLPLTEFFCPFNDHSPPAGRQGDLLASSMPSPPVLPPRVEMPQINELDWKLLGDLARTVHIEPWECTLLARLFSWLRRCPREEDNAYDVTIQLV